MVGSVAGATQEGGELLVAASSIPAVLGMVLLVPIVLALVASVSARLPLVFRYAVRDANRHRTRTVPAVSAVAATVAGVVALGIGLTSDNAENRGTYTPSVAAGVGIVTSPPTPVAKGPVDDEPPWSELRSVVTREVPDATVTDAVGLSEANAYTEILVGREPLLYSYGGAVGVAVMVSDDALPLGLIGISKDDAARASAALRGGGAVAFTNADRPDGVVTVVSNTFDEDTGVDSDVTRTKTPATFIAVPPTWVGPAGVISSGVAAELGVQPVTVALAVTGVDITTTQQAAVDEGLASVSQDAMLYVERGYQADDAVVIVKLVLLGLGALLMLGGTLTATFLALSDARPDLATLSAVGASPRTRRGVAGAYAIAVGVVGAVLGAAVGFVPGIAVAYRLTKVESGVPIPGAGVPPGTGPFIDVPWLMVLALVVALPLATALVVGLFARSRLPLVARLD